MAGSRLERFTPLFSRVQGLIRSGAVAPDGAPLWYEVYARFPPAEEPRFERPTPPQFVRPILYAEDVDRQRRFVEAGEAGAGRPYNLFKLEAEPIASASGSATSTTTFDAGELARHVTIVARLRPDLSEAERLNLAKQLCAEAGAKGQNAA